MAAPNLEELLVERARELDALVRRHAGALLARETAEDLAQSIRLRILERSDGFEWRGEAAFGAWLRTVARNELDARRAHWNAARRSAGRLLRLTYGPASGAEAGRAAQPADGATGPLSFAERRDLVDLAVRALETLPDRDQRLVELTQSGATTREIGERLGLGLEAATKARQRALERFRRAFELIAR
ncbi:MAG: sigma-70 family RNA polymerase sigma factor [Planctomycetota bacterium]